VPGLKLVLSEGGFGVSGTLLALCVGLGDGGVLLAPPCLHGAPLREGVGLALWYRAGVSPSSPPMGVGDAGAVQRCMAASGGQSNNAAACEGQNGCA